MNTYADKTQENKSQSTANEFAQDQSGGKFTFQFIDNRPEAIAQRKLQEMANNNQRAMQFRAIREMAINSLQAEQAAQLRSLINNSTQEQQPIQKIKNNTGLPDNLKSGIENLSDYSMDDVKVHYDSGKPVQLNAHAYAQGTNIYVASGQEKHLPHEAWHVVQQKQGRVVPTIQMKNGVNINDDKSLEKEADIMGNHALRNNTMLGSSPFSSKQLSNPAQAIQRKPQDVQIVWEITHVVKEQDESLIGSRDFEEGEIGPKGELTAGQVITIDDEDIFVSRRGPNQEDPTVREHDIGRDPNKEWFRVLALDSDNVYADNLYVRNGTFVPLKDTRTIAERVKAALTMATRDLSRESIMASLQTHFATYQGGLLAATREEEFAATLLEEIRNKQSKKWIEATQIHQVPEVQWQNNELQHWTVRHYTNKLKVTLGKDLGQGYFKVAQVGPPPFDEILSTITLAAMSSTEESSEFPYKPGDTMMMANSSASSTSGHTTAVDWTNIGNVGDTFYALFYKEEPATGITPNFIRDAVYYAIWSADEFGIGWASADWLGTAKDSRKEDGTTPRGIAREGTISDIIADIFPEAATRDFSESGDQESSSSKSQREEKFKAMRNFEIKKHGPMPVREWYPIPGNLDKIKNYVVNTNTGAFHKLIMTLPSSVQEKYNG